MYKSDPLLLNKFNERVQHPSPLIYITRNKTPISAQRFWERELITTTIGTRSSIAVRRPEGSFEADMVFTAQVENGTAVIRFAEPWPNIEDMKWNILTTIPNVSELSIMFDGIMKKVDGKVECYTVGNRPYAIYVNTDGSLKAINLNEDTPSVITISDMAINIASVRGLYAPLSGVDDGILIFYTNTSKELWEAQLLNGTIQYLSKIDMLPTGVTGWDDVWASLTFDYRVELQLKGDDGKVYTLMSKSRPSGFAISETIEYFASIAEPPFAQIGYAPPLLFNAYNTAAKPLEVKLVFDGPIYIFDFDTKRVWLTGSDGRIVYPKSIDATKTNEITLTFDTDLFGLLRPQVLHDYKYRPCGFGGPDGVSAIIDGWQPQLLGIDLSGAGEEVLNYFASVYSLSGDLVKAFDGKSYSPTEIIQYFASPHIPSGPVSGTLVDVTFVKGYNLPNENIINYFTSVYSSMSGTLLKADGTPI